MKLPASVIGHQIGGGMGNAAATIAGAVGGAASAIACAS